MNIFKKKIVKKCNHKFVYYNKDIVSKSYSLAQYEFSFVCTLCERVYKISYNDILSLLSKLIHHSYVRQKISFVLIW